MFPLLPLGKKLRKNHTGTFYERTHTHKTTYLKIMPKMLTRPDVSRVGRP